MPEAVARLRGLHMPGGTMDLDVLAGEVILLRGPNGAGKTSILRALAGLSVPFPVDRVEVAGREPSGVPAADMPALAHMAMQDPRDGLAGLTVAGEFRLRRQRVPPAQAPLDERLVATLSSGQARRLALAIAASGAPVLWLLDEPAEGLDAQGLALLADAVARRGTTAVVATDHSGWLAAMATRVLALPQAQEAPLPPLPPPGDGPLVKAGPAAIDRGGSTVSTPGVRLPAGFHVAAGPNASGKSTLLLRLAGLLGDGVQLLGMAPRPGTSARLLLPWAREGLLRLTVAEELRGCDPVVAQALVPAALLQRHPLSLSGGEAQRVAVAKTLGRRAPLYLLDEPDAHLDAAGRSALAQAIVRRVAQGSCVVAATHDAALAGWADSTVTCGAAR